VGFEVLPAIDVARGRLVSVSTGEVRELDAFGGSPLAAAEAFVEAGARWLHVVDVDRADGRPPDLALLRRIAGIAPHVQASGGIASAGAVQEALEADAGRVVLSSSMLADRASLAATVARFADRVVLGIEAAGDLIRPRAAGASELPLGETLAWARTLGAAAYLYTGLARVAALSGPDLDGVRTAASILGGPVLVAGGIRGAEDVLAVRALGPSAAAGCVVGRALYQGLDLRTVLAEIA
jgi:phosphoribosylformimino-5-aminoimidazole carboxamide ribonucleotide (ProFAR) isomerase